MKLILERSRLKRKLTLLITSNEGSAKIISRDCCRCKMEANNEEARYDGLTFCRSSRDGINDWEKGRGPEPGEPGPEPLGGA